MTTAPLISIVLPTLNGSRFIVDSIESCLRQTHAAFELLIVDGGSTDGTQDLVRAMADPRLRLVQQANNVERLPGALNCGFAQAKGEFLTWAQDDDLYEPQALEVLLAALLADPDAGLAYTGMWLIDETGQKLREADFLPPDDLYWTNVVGHCFLYRRSVAQQVGAYDPAFWMAEDHHYWLRIHRRSRLIRVPGRYYHHRLHAGSLTVRNYGRYTALRVAARARREVLGLDWPTYRRQVAAAYIEEAFAALERRDGAHVRRCLWRGLWRDPRWLRNRGVLSMAAQGYFGYKRRP